MKGPFPPCPECRAPMLPVEAMSDFNRFQGRPGRLYACPPERACYFVFTDTERPPQTVATDGSMRISIGPDGLSIEQ